jgi:peptidyl-dipeptidase Dcp
MNPFLQDWTSEFGLPPFGEIEAKHFSEALDQGFKEHRSAVNAIVASEKPATFATVIEALEQSDELTEKVANVFFNLTGADTSPELQELERDFAPRFAKQSNETFSNAALFAKVSAVYDGDQSDLSSEQKRVLKRYYDIFVRAGASLKEDGRSRISEISQRLATLGTLFAQNVLAEENAFELVLDSEADLAGLPDFVRSAASQTAEVLGHSGKYVITPSRSSIAPFLQFSDRRDLREEAWRAWSKRGENRDERDNQELVLETLRLRQEKAQLLGFGNFAAYKVDNEMAKKPAAVLKLLRSVWAPAKERALGETKKLQAMIQEDGGNFELKPWDWHYYAEKVRKAEYDLDETELKPYFQLDKMIDAAFATANRLFGITAKELKGLDLYHPDARAWEISDAEGEHVGVFIGDYFARPSKRSGAWMSSFRDQQRLVGVVSPVIINVMNFNKAPEGEAALLTFDDARTLFHEFGHALHGLLSNVTYPLVSGTSVARDFVELPSQLYEHWLSEPVILNEFAIHYKTGEALPQDLLAKLKAAENFNQGFATVEYVSSALADMELHLLDDLKNLNLKDFEADLYKDIGMPEAVMMRHRIPHFAHAFAGDGYSAGYYSYMWSEVMDADAFAAFEETGDAFDEELAERLKTSIYSAGGMQDPEDAYIDFRGRLPTIDALLEKRGLADAA